MLMRDSMSGTFELYDISKNAIISASSMGGVGQDWQIAGFGNFSSNPNETDMLLRNVNTRSLELYDITNNSITLATSMGQVGLDWQVVGVGDFSSNPNETDMLLRNANTGAFEVYDINHNSITLASSLGSAGLDWQIVSLGDFSGNPNETDMLLKNSTTGEFQLYDISNNNITATASLGQLGLSGQVNGANSSSTFADPAPISTNTLYVFLGSFGHADVQQFDPFLDVIELQVTELPDFATVQSHMQQVGSNTIITYDANDSITLVGVPMSSLHAPNFEFTHGEVS